MMNEISKAKMDLSSSERHMLETRFSQDGLAFQRSGSKTNDLKSRTSQEGSQYGSAQTEDMMSQDNFSFHSLDLGQPRKGSIEVNKEDKSLKKLNDKRKRKMRQTQAGC